MVAVPLLYGNLVAEHYEDASITPTRVLTRYGKKW
jgi:hypothetical protein